MQVSSFQTLIIFSTELVFLKEPQCEIQHGNAVLQKKNKIKLSDNVI